MGADTAGYEPDGVERVRGIIITALDASTSSPCVVCVCVVWCGRLVRVCGWCVVWLVGTCVVCGWMHYILSG